MLVIRTNNRPIILFIRKILLKIEIISAGCVMVIGTTIVRLAIGTIFIYGIRLIFTFSFIHIDAVFGCAVICAFRTG